MSVSRWVVSAAVLVSGSLAVADDGKSEEGFRLLFDGKTIEGWDGDLSVFRIEDGSIVGGQLKEKIPHNFFLSHKDEFSDFELRLQFKLLGERTNAGMAEKIVTEAEADLASAVAPLGIASSTSDGIVSPKPLRDALIAATAAVLDPLLCRTACFRCPYMCAPP